MKRADYQTAENISLVMRYDIDPYVRLPFILTATGLSSSTIFRLIQAGKFPKSFKLTEHTSVWRLSEVRQWMEERGDSHKPRKRK